MKLLIWFENLFTIVVRACELYSNKTRAALTFSVRYKSREINFNLSTMCSQSLIQDHSKHQVFQTTIVARCRECEFGIPIYVTTVIAYLSILLISAYNSEAVYYANYCYRKFFTNNNLSSVIDNCTIENRYGAA